MLRASSLLLQARGRYSSMLDMGGISTKESSKVLDVGKNNKIRAIALDFNVIVRSIDSQRQQQHAMVREDDYTNGGSGNSTGGSNRRESEMVKPNVGVVENIANLLGVDLGGDGTNKNQPLRHRKSEEDDLAGITGESPTNNKNDSKKNQTIPSNDIRTKYAQKLRSHGVEGGLAGVELANHNKEQALTKGDAAIKFTAKEMLASTEKKRGVGGDKWLAESGTGTLLTYLNQRSVKIALLPSPMSSCESSETNSLEEEEKEEQRRMNLLIEQLPSVTIDLLLCRPSASSSNNEKLTTTNANANANAANNILHNLTSTTAIPPLATMVVSDRDEYLLAGKNLGMYTCRIRPKNAPRGNVTASYSVASVEGVEDVMNDVNGISFNTVFSQR